MSTVTVSSRPPVAARPILLAAFRPRLRPAPFAAAAVAWLVAYLAAEPLSHLLAFRVLGLGPSSRLGSAVAFFAYEVPKVLLLLVAVVFVIGIANTWFTAERTRRILSGRRESVGNVLAALLGVVTPFCSCSAVPLFIGFLEAGVPLGVTFSFLVSAPMVNEVALVLLFGLFGWRIATIYLLTGLSVAVLSGLVLGRLKLERHIEEWVRELRCCPPQGSEEPLTLSERAWKGVESARKVVGKTWPYVLAGIGVGAFIHGWVPEGLLAGVMGRQAWWSVPLAVAIGVPVYAGTATLIPIVQALLAKGAALGTVLAFMMAVVGLSLPEFILLRRVLRPRLLGAFIGVVSLGILLVGWLFNAFL
ncbi:MAG TPA: permease [Anaeromyxobacteraceae bacterium]|nr:permease [Anaeromyxobacteraceae bacterium]